MYFEQQKSFDCLIHSLNNVLGANLITVDIMNLCVCHAKLNWEQQKEIVWAKKRTSEASKQKQRDTFSRGLSTNGTKFNPMLTKCALLRVGRSIGRNIKKDILSYSSWKKYTTKEHISGFLLITSKTPNKYTLAYNHAISVKVKDSKLYLLDSEYKGIILLTSSKYKTIMKPYKIHSIQPIKHLVDDDDDETDDEEDSTEEPIDLTELLSDSD